MRVRNSEKGSVQKYRVDLCDLLAAISLFFQNIYLAEKIAGFLI